MNPEAPAHFARPKYPPGFRARRGLNWGILGLMYASYYMCRYNFRFATPGMVQEFGFDEVQITGMLSAWSIAYGTGQLVNGLITDRKEVQGVAANGELMEVFEWESVEKSRGAPAIAEIGAHWKAMGEVMDFVPLSEVPEAQHPFAHFNPI